VPILAAVHEEKVLRRLTIVWGVLPCATVSEAENPEKMLKDFLKMALKKGLIDKEEVLVITMGSQIGKVGSTNMIRLVRKEELEEEVALIYATPDS
jgi:pyruvate kinase